MNEIIQNIIKKTKAYNCVECGKCSSVCPISLIHDVCLPRATVRKAIFETPEALFNDELLWSCLTCGLCYERCEFDVNFPKFIKDLRISAHKLGKTGIYAHNGALQSMMKIMTLPDLKQNRLNWLTDELKVKIYSLTTQRPNDPMTNDPMTLYFLGCLPQFDAFFPDLQLINIARNTIKILNHLGIEPVLLPDEKCCGHDLLWTGDYDSFKKLALQNIESIKRTGAKKIITSCPECYYTLKETYQASLYPEYIAKLPVEILHISQLISENLPSIPTFQHSNTPFKLTYQDPCRLGRFSGIYEEPRKILTAIKGVELCEMEHNRKSAICCGTSGWMNCGTYSKQIQLARLKEAKNTGANLLITSCHKCLIHLNCAQTDKNTNPNNQIKLQDLTSFLVNSM